jgi:basic amino acid/polyamine antiporter, APA family
MGGLRQSLGLIPLTFYGVGIIIGAGIYSVIGAAAAEAGESLWLAFLASAVVALLTGLSYAELTTMFPKAGAEYVYLREAFPKVLWLAFFTGFILVIAGAATASTVSISFASYLNGFYEFPVWLAAAILLGMCALIAIAGIKESSWVNIVFTSIEVVGLVMVIVAGAQSPRFGQALTTPLNSGIFAAAAILFFVYLGFEEIANLAEEAKDVARTLPRAILISLGITTLLYTLVSLASVALVSPMAMAQSESSMAVVAHSVSPLFGKILGAVAMFATANTALIAIIATSRIVYAMARDSQLPAFLGTILPNKSTPWLATILVTAISLAMLPLGRVATTASVSSLASLLAFVAVNVTVIVLRYRQPDRERPFRVPWTIGRLPLLPLLGVVASAAMMTQFDPIVYYICAGLVAVGIAFHLLWKRSSTR